MSALACTCREPVEICTADGLLTYERCGAPAEPEAIQIATRDGVSLTSIGRRVVVAGPYCSSHGGHARAVAESLRDWDYLAPAAVVDVQGAGCASLASEHAYVSVRYQDGCWLAWLGAGSHLTAVESPSYAGCARAGCRRCAHARETGDAQWCGKGRCRFGSREAAVQAATDAWRSALARRVDEIRSRRGGTLAWGLPVAPLAEPHVVEPGPGETAWDVVRRTGASAPVGTAWITGVRPSGESL